MYYVYEFFDVNSGDIVYVGKGKGKRYKVTSQRNHVFTEYLKNNKCESRIVQTFENEEEAFQFEYEYIKKLKGTGQCICNLHSGGAGGSGEYWSEELRKEYSENNVMKSPEQKKRMSENNPMKNPEIARKTNSQKQRPVIIGNVEFPSIKIASKKLGAATDSIALWCKKGINYKGEKCRYKDEEQVEFTGKRYNKGGCKALTYLGKHYESPLDLAEELGLSETTVYSWVKRGFSPDGTPCKYDDDTRELKYENRLPNLNHEIFCQRLSEIDPTIEVLEVFKNTRSKIQCRCIVCGYEWSPTGNNLLQGKSHCPNCSKTKATYLTRMSTDNFYRKVADINDAVEIIGQFKGTKSRIDCRCKICGNTWAPIAGSLLSGRGCRRCAYAQSGKKNTLSPSVFIEKLSKINPNIVVLEDYSGSYTKIKCKCLLCDYEWNAVPHYLLTNRGCPQCSRRNMKKR